MLRDRPQTQSELEGVCIDELVPSDHLLRKVDRHNGRPALNPTLMFKLLLVGYLFGIRSERQLNREVQINVAYRWFLGLNLTNTAPDASTLSQNRRRFNDSDVYQQIFDAVVVQTMKRNLVSGTGLYTDSTPLKANANKGKWVKAQALSEWQAYEPKTSAL